MSIFGAGFVGLTTAAVFADKGFKTRIVDINEEKIAKINVGEAPFYEPNLELLLQAVVIKKKTLKASLYNEEVISSSNLIFICVGTPSQENGNSDLKYIEEVAKGIGKALKENINYPLIVVKSTVPPITTRAIVQEIIEKESKKKSGIDFGLCMNPEFLREGQSIHDTLFPDRIIIGEINKNSGDILENFYRTLYARNSNLFGKNWHKIYQKKITCPPILRFSLETAECIKYANNSFLATKISFINEFANICELLPGVDIQDIAYGIGLDKRINPHFLQAGVGFGGSCFPKDVNGIIYFARKFGYHPSLLESVMKINEFQANHMVDLTIEKLSEVQGKKIAVLGLSFKPNTDDMRNAPSIPIINSLITKGAEVVVWDPMAMNVAKKEHQLSEKVIYSESIESALRNADACLIITDWAIFKNLQPNDFKIMKNPLVLDGRRIYDSQYFKQEGIDYLGIGLGL